MSRTSPLTPASVALSRLESAPVPPNLVLAALLLERLLLHRARARPLGRRQRVLPDEVLHVRLLSAVPRELPALGAERIVSSIADHRGDPLVELAERPPERLADGDADRPEVRGQD